MVTLARLTLNTITTDFGTLTEADFNTGSKDATGPLANVKANNTWTLTVKSSTATWSGGAGTKPAADLTWRRASVGGAYSNVMSTTAATLNSGVATNGSDETIEYRSLWTYALDGPGSLLADGRIHAQRAVKQGLTTQTPPGCTHSRAPRARLCRGLVVVGATALAAIVPFGPVAAQIAVDQLELVFQTKPGNPRLGIINLRNESDRAVQAVVKLEDWDRAEDGTNRWYPVGTVPGSCGKALEIFPPTVSLDPGASQAVRVTFDSTAAIIGECWAAAIVETVAPRMDGDRGIRNVIRTATKIYVQAEGLTAAGEVVALRPAMMLLKDRPDSVVAFRGRVCQHRPAARGGEG